MVGGEKEVKESQLEGPGREITKAKRKKGKGEVQT